MKGLLTLAYALFLIYNSLAGDFDIPLEKTEKEESFTQIPTIPELSPSIKDPAKWKNGTRLIFFYTPWCSYSQALRPLLYGLIEQIYYHNISSIFIGQIDVSVHSDVARTFRIKATPSLLLFRNGTRYEFIDDVSLVNLVKFVVTIMKQSITEVNTTNQMKDFLREHPVSFILVHDQEIHNDWQVIYERVAQERVLTAHFMYTTDPDIVNELGYKLLSLPNIAVLKDGQHFEYTGVLTKYQVTLWVESEQFPALPTANASSLRHFTSTGLIKRLVILLVANEQGRDITQKKAYEAVRRVALGRKLQTGYQFLIIEDPNLAEKITSKSLQPPSLFVWEHHTGHYFLYEEKYYTEKGVASFLYSVTAGKIQAQGGPGYFNSLYNWYWWLYNLIQIMISHRPFLSLLAVVLLVTGFIICVYSRMTRPKLDLKRKEAIARARARHRENERRRKRLEKLRQEQEDKKESGSEEIDEESDDDDGSEEEKKTK